MELDSLEIKVQSSSQEAASGLDKLAASLGNLKSAAKGGAGLSTLAKGLERINASLSSSAVSGSKIQSLVSALNGLSQIQKATGLNSVVNSLKKLPDISSSLDKLDLDKFASQIQRVATAMKPLATEMEKVANGFKAFPIRIQKIIQSNNALTSSNAKATRSFNLLNKGINLYIFQRVASIMAGWVTSANEYIENVNLFQVSMGEFYDEAFAYAQLVSDRLGIDPSEWMRNQGVFMSMANGFGLAREQAYALSEGLTELSYDLSSLYNEKVEQSALRLQSALAGEIEPIRRLGISISQATLQEYALAHGIDESVTAMTEQEKALLRSLVLMEGASRVGAIGDFAKTLESPANAMRVLHQQITQLGRALGTVLLPIIVQIIPWVQAFVSVLTDAISALATFMGFTMPEWDTSDWGSNVSSGVSDIADSMGSATEAAKELKNATIGIDELNIISPQTSSGTGSGAGASGWTQNVEIPNIWDQEAIAQIQTKASELEGKLKSILKVVLAIGAAFAAWKIATGLSNGIIAISNGVGAISKAIGILAGKSGLAGVAGIVAGISTQFHVAGGGAAGLLSVVKLIGETLLSSPAAAIAIIAAQFVNLYTGSEAFRKGLERIGDIFFGAFSVAKDILFGVLSVLGDIGSAILGILPESVRATILNGLETILGAVEALDLGFGDVIVTALGIAAMFVPGGQVVGVMLLGFEALSAGLRGLGLISDETWAEIKTAAQNAWNHVKEAAGAAVSDMKNGLVYAWDSIVEFFTEALPNWWNTTIAPWFTLEKWAELGKNILDGLVNGLKSAWDAMKGFGKSILDAVCTVLGVNSPSKEFEAIGEYSVAGFELGLSKMSNITAIFQGYLGTMMELATAFANNTNALIGSVLQSLQQALGVGMEATTATTDDMASSFQTMADRSNAAIRSVISYLDSIPRSITTVHTIITKSVSSGSSSGTKAYASGGYPETGQLFLAREAGPELVG